MSDEIRLRLMRDLQRDFPWMTPDMASGVVGSMAVESDNFRAGEQYGGGPGVGWLQWELPRGGGSGRGTGLQNYMRNTGHGYDPNTGQYDYRNYDANYGFFREEANTPLFSRWLNPLRATATAAEAARDFTGSRDAQTGYLRPGIPHVERRIGQAESTLGLWNSRNDNPIWHNLAAYTSEGYDPQLPPPPGPYNAGGLTPQFAGTTNFLVGTGAGGDSMNYGYGFQPQPSGAQFSGDPSAGYINPVFGTDWADPELMNLGPSRYNAGFAGMRAGGQDVAGLDLTGVAFDRNNNTLGNTAVSGDFDAALRGLRERYERMDPNTIGIPDSSQYAGRYDYSGDIRPQDALFLEEVAGGRVTREGRQVIPTEMASAVLGLGSAQDYAGRAAYSGPLAVEDALWLKQNPTGSIGRTPWDARTSSTEWSPWTKPPVSVQSQGFDYFLPTAALRGGAATGQYADWGVGDPGFNTTPAWGLTDPGFPPPRTAGPAYDYGTGMGIGLPDIAPNAGYNPFQATPGPSFSGDPVAGYNDPAYGSGSAWSSGAPSAASINGFATPSTPGFSSFGINPIYNPSPQQAQNDYVNAGGIVPGTGAALEGGMTAQDVALNNADYERSKAVSAAYTQQYESGLAALPSSTANYNAMITQPYNQNFSGQIAGYNPFSTQYQPY